MDCLNSFESRSAFLFEDRLHLFLKSANQYLLIIIFFGEIFKTLADTKKLDNSKAEKFLNVKMPNMKRIVKNIIKNYKKTTQLINN